ncbi:hypothetical protein [Nocardia sp. NPDC004722]
MNVVQNLEKSYRGMGFVPVYVHVMTDQVTDTTAEPNAVAELWGRGH